MTLEFFNNRELAAIIWTVVFFAWALTKKDLRKAFSIPLKAVLAWQILLPALLMGAYLTAIIVTLFKFDLWDFFLLKDTLFWFFSVAVILMYRFVAARGGSLPFREVITDNLKMIVILEFLINTYTFSLGMELVLIPLAVIVGSMNAIAGEKKEHQIVAKFTKVLIVLMGICTIVMAVYSAVSDYKTLGTIDTIQSLALPVFLSSGLIPFVYLLAVYTNYESLFIGFKIGKKKSLRFVRYCKWVIVGHCLLNIKKVAQLKPYNLMNLEEVDDLDQLLCELDNRVDNAE